MTKRTLKSQKSQSSKKTTPKVETQGEGEKVILDTSPQKKTYRSRAWFMTLNNPEKYGFNSFQEFIEIFNGLKVKMYAGQYEKGEDTEMKTYQYDNWTGDEEPIIIKKSGTIHLQFCIYFENQINWTSLVQLCPKIHWETCKSWKKSVIYCTKEDTRIEGPYVKGIQIDKKIDVKLRGWQLQLLKKLDEEPNRRDIYWIHERKGGVGKSLMSVWLHDHRKAIVVSGKCDNIAFALSEKINDFPKIVIIDVPRSNDQSHLSYSIIEQIKTGMLFSGKYESKSIRFEIPHVVIFSNREPDINKLSKDRWKIYTIHKDKLLRKEIILDSESESEDIPEGYYEE